MDEKEMIDEIIREVKARLGYECAVSGRKGKAAVIGQLSMEDERAVKSAYDIAPFSEAADILIVAQMSTGLLVQLALGMMDGFESSCILQTLLKGGKVYILEDGIEYRKYKTSAYKPLYRMYQEYEEAMMRFGAEIAACAGDIISERGRVAVKKSEYEDLTGIRLLRESDLVKTRSTGRLTVLVDKAALITPLAADYIASHNLSVIRQ